MKEAILRLLKERRPEYVSGEEICRSLDVTRTAVWKHIQALREDGYMIDARPRAGYLLTGVPDRLFPEEIRDGLATRFMGRTVFYSESISSTNDLAKELARKGAGEGSLVVAEEQTGGKGRLGRGWFSPRYKGIWFSLILHPPVDPSEASRVTMLAAVAVASAIRKSTGVAAGIKWPNDLLAGGKKICGILAELSAEMDRINHLVVGVGINANLDAGDFPEEVRSAATSLKMEAGRTVSRVRLLQECLTEFERWYTAWLDGGFAPVLARWKDMAISLHCPVRIHTLNKSWDGWAEDVDEDGALLVRLPGGGVQRLVSGEVSLRLS
ncbi:MAG: biotin--[acetyl-CoA-carboxylase] ligase [Peptococcaceae bacterium]|nr:biotin--[acetyl-CoA-carboxylase] ligase [Peptococcaceae bacterium]